MELSFSQTSIEDGTRRTLHLKNRARQPDIDVIFDLVGIKPPVPTVLDGFVFGIILAAMRMRENIYVSGAMSREALSNLNEFQEAWSLWRPDLYKKVEISCSTILDTVPAGPGGAIAAFSGGVDSLFTILRHGKPLLGSAAYPLQRAVLMVHGFDVPLQDLIALERLQKRTRPFLDTLGLQLLTLRTNIKELDLQDWEDSFMPQLACCLHNYSHDFRYGLAGSSEPYDALILPWGSNPATDHLLSGSAMRLVHDGAGFSRTDKVAAIAQDQKATEILKVCWEGNDPARNCGRCEKCIRTQLNFLAVGHDTPGCFDHPLDLSLIPSIVLNNTAQCAELRSILRYAESHRVSAPWVDLLAARIAAFKPPSKAKVILGKLGRLFALLKEGDLNAFIGRIRKRLG